MERLIIDEVILKEKRIYAENQKIVDTHVLCGEFTLEELYCDDTEVIEESLMHRKFDSEYHKQLAEWLEELKAYKTAEEQGLLLRLVCDVGDSIYYPYVQGDEVIDFQVVEIKIYEDGVRYLDDSDNEWDECDFDTILFLTREEAERALAEMQKG